jgi:predicted glutamine amidotransferase
MSTENSRLLHKDGFGLCDSELKVIKTSIEPNNLLNLGKDFLNISNLSGRVLFHVRRASSINKDVSSDKAHPFESKDLILAHNGTLEYLGRKVLPLNTIDSEDFLFVLQQEYEIDKNLPAALKRAYLEFRGKFAFIIVDKNTKQYYIARGNTATVHKVNIKITYNNGNIENCLALNTEKDSFISALVRFKNIAEMLYEVQIDIDFSKIDLIPENSIFILEEDKIKKIDDIKEVAIPEPVRLIVPVNSSSNYLKDASPTHKDIINFMNSFGITLWELDKLVHIMCEKPLISCADRDLEDFNELIISNLVKDREKYITKKKTKVWEKVRKAFTHNFEKIYEYIEFPYFVNEVKDLEKALSYAK